MKMTAMSEGSQLRKLIHSFQSGGHQFNHVTVFPDHLFVHRKPRWCGYKSVISLFNSVRPFKDMRIHDFS